jgi:starch synthase
MTKKTPNRSTDKTPPRAELPEGGRNGTKEADTAPEQGLSAPPAKPAEKPLASAVPSALIQAKQTLALPAPVEKSKLDQKAAPAVRESQTFSAEALALEPLEPQPQLETQETVSPQPAQESSVRAPVSVPAMYIVQITPELAWAAKVGGLADVVFGLSNELELRGNHVEILLPKYDCMRYDHIFGLTEVYKDLWVPWYGGAIHCSVYFGFVHGRKCFFIDAHSRDNFFNRGGIYGFDDDVFRFAFFSRAAMEFLWKSGKHPDIIHCHDWQTALVPVFLYEIYKYLGMTHPRVCYTIHNFKHQGVTGAEILYATGLNRPEYYFHYDRLRDNWNPNALNLMKGGIVYSNFITTVSPHYAMEAKDQGQAFGLEPTLHIHHLKYGGVVNGVDYSTWNPEIDRYIPFQYGLANLDDKYQNKKALRERLLLADNEKPIVAFIGRLDPQKGLELIRHAIFYTLQRGGQFVLLGSSPDRQINGYFWGLKHQLNDNPDCHLEIGFSEELSHLIYAGADMLVVPSRFEPCGLTQLIAMRYGTIPIVRAVGGLADTVHDKDFSPRPLHERNGYVFRDYDYPGLESALGRAISCYYDYPQDFRELIKNAMRCDYSWKNPGQDYLNIYDYIRDK